MKQPKLYLYLFLAALVGSFTFSSCKKKENTEEQSEVKDTTKAETESKMEVTKVSFGKVNDSTEVFLYTLKNDKGMEVKITNYGGIVTHIFTADKDGKTGDVVLGFDSLANYQETHPYFGALIGRYGNRIAKGKFTLDGKQYTLAINNGPNHLHGGLKGFDKVVWSSEELKENGKVGVKLNYLSKDMEEGYPGNLTVGVIYTLNNDNELRIEYTAETDKKTILNLTNHSYFNLSAGQAKDALHHQLTINADHYTPVDKTLIPTGEIKSVKGTEMDFTTPHTIGERIAKVDGGYDHNYVLNDTTGSLSLAATVYDSISGRVMEVLTDQPGVQFYSGNFLGVGGTLTGKGNIKYVKHYGFCLETQHFPDSPNKPKFPSVVLAPGEKLNSTTVYKFSVR